MKRALGFKVLALLILIGGVIMAKETVGNDRPARAAVAAGLGGPPPWVAVLAKKVAVENGDEQPSSALAVLTTRQAALRVGSGIWVSTNQATYYVVLRGHFVDVNAYTPNGQPVYGTVMKLNIDASTQGILDFGLSDRVPAIAELGTVTDITNQL